MYKGRHMRLPVSFVIRIQGSQHAQECSIHPRCGPVPHSVVRRSPRLIHASDVAKLLDDLALEVSALITVKTSWEPIMHKETVEKGLRCGLGCLVPSGDGLGVLREVVSDDKQMFKTTLRFLQRQIIHADELHGLGCPNVHKRGSGWGRLVGKAPPTISNLLFNISGHAWPVEPVSHQRQRSIASLMSNVVMESSQYIGLVHLGQYQLQLRLVIYGRLSVQESPA